MGPPNYHKKIQPYWPSQLGAQDFGNMGSGLNKGQKSKVSKSAILKSQNIDQLSWLWKYQNWGKKSIKGTTKVEKNKFDEWPYFFRDNKVSWFRLNFEIQKKNETNIDIPYR